MNTYILYTLHMYYICKHKVFLWLSWSILVFFIHLLCFPDQVPLLLFFLFIAPVLLSASLHLFLRLPCPQHGSLLLFWFLQVLKVICSHLKSQNQGLWKSIWRNSQKAKVDLPYKRAMPLLGICPRNSTSCSMDTYSSIFLPIYISIAMKWKRPKWCTRESIQP